MSRAAFVIVANKQSIRGQRSEASRGWGGVGDRASGKQGNKKKDGKPFSYPHSVNDINTHCPDTSMDPRVVSAVWPPL